jgi:hypothetical protein
MHNIPFLNNFLILEITKEIHIISEPNEYKKSGSRPSKIPLLLKYKFASN